MTVDEMLDAIQDRMTAVPWGLVAMTVERQPNDWLRVTLANGQTLAVTVEEL